MIGGAVEEFPSRRVWWLTLFVVAAGQGVNAQPATLGGEFQVNTYTTNFQAGADVSVGPGGEFVVVWTSVGSDGSDSLYTSVQGRRYASDATALGGDFQVNTYTSDRQGGADVSHGPGGEFVVVWGGNGSSGSDSSFWSIQGRRYASDGTALGNDFQVNIYTTGMQLNPDVSVGPGGEFVVVWDSLGSDGSDNFYGSIQGRRYASDGTALGSNFQVNTYTTRSQDYPGVSVGPGGEFVVVWTSDGSNGSDSSSQSVQGQRYASDGTALGNNFQVNTYTTVGQSYPGVSVGPSGEFVVVWESATSLSDYSHPIAGRRYASDGTELGSDFQVNTYTQGIQSHPDVSIGPGGEFAVVWDSNGSSGSDWNMSIQGRRYASDGTALGSDFQVNTYTTNSQYRPGVSFGPGGEFVVVWDSDGSSGSDNSSVSIQGQRYAALFSDGFESGDTSAWSATVP